jgi:hypothetical protein
MTSNSELKSSHGGIRLNRFMGTSDVEVNGVEPGESEELGGGGSEEMEGAGGGKDERSCTSVERK